MDWKWTVTAVLPVISLVLGAWLTQLNDRRRDAAQLRREEAAHTLERHRQRDDRQEEFELAHLADLHSALTDLVSSGIALCFQRIGKPLPRSEDANTPEADEFWENHRRVSALRTLVLDDQIRADVQALQGRFVEATSNPWDENSSRAQPSARGLAVQAEQVSEQVAARVREIYKTRQP
ncbi:hypothetical protein [Streptomyces sp. NPDC048188]|uniref:hypothetical protein n=1 Tax=Streptomyces sp. NPDC048188 TaxID=3155749 RepID=UPI00342C1781